MATAYLRWYLIQNKLDLNWVENKIVFVMLINKMKWFDSRSYFIPRIRLKISRNEVSFTIELKTLVHIQNLKFKRNETKFLWLERNHDLR